MRRLYLEIGHGGFPWVVAGALAFSGPSRLLFGTDFPVEPYATTTREAYLTIDATGSFVLASNHGNYDPVSQQSPHAHSVNLDPSNRFAIVCDKGADRLYVYRVDAESRTFANGKTFSTAPGISPRHSAFHPGLPYVYIIDEILNMDC